MVGRNCKVGEVKAILQPGTEWCGHLKASWLTPEPIWLRLCVQKNSQP